MGTSDDVKILQTASAIEIQAVATYNSFLTLQVVRGGNPALIRFAQTTLFQHDEHRQAFQSQTQALGGPKQEAAHPGLQSLVEQAIPGLHGPLDVVNLAEHLETIATRTYLVDVPRLTDPAARRAMASVLGVQAQLAAVLRAAKALLADPTTDLFTIPLDPAAASLPAALVGAAFPDPFEPTTEALGPETGAVA